jgi:anti-sigma regulatory factor (Ser/Thr protein kinase)
VSGLTAVVLPHAPASAAVARRSLTTELSAAGVSHTVIGDAALVISELVGNAIRHASPLPGGAVRVEWALHPDTVEIAVMDGGSTELPVAVHADEAAIGGRGLSIVEALSRTWGTRRAGSGMVVWAHIPRVQGGRARRGCEPLATVT